MKAHRALIYVAYCLPLLTAFFLTIWFALPHMWFVYEGESYENTSIFALVETTWENRDSEEANEGLNNAEAVNRMRAVIVVAFWCAFTMMWVFSVLVAACALLALSLPPTERLTNRTKRVLYLLCPNRITYLLGCVLPLLPALFPGVLIFCYQNLYQLAVGMRIGYEPFADWIMAAIAAGLSVAAFILTLPWQREEHMDLFRIYKSGRQVAGKGEEQI